MFHDNNLLRIESSPYRADATDISYLRAQIPIAEEELRKLDVNLAILLAKRSCVVRYIKRCQASMAPYSKLPTELIEEIITCAVELPQCLLSAYNRNDPRLQITQICSSWRKVAFGIPALWNVNPCEPPRESTAKLISAWLRQCSSTQIMLHASPEWYLPWSRHGGFVMEDVIAAYAHRIKALSFFPILHQHFYSLRWDVLTSISLCNIPWTKLEPGDYPKMPNLREFKVYNLHPCELLPSLPTLPLEQLTVLSLTGFLDIAEVYGALLRCSSHTLEQCHLNQICSNTSNLLPSGSFNFPNLKQLSLTIDRDHPSLFLWLDLFNTPKISSLTISCPPDDPQVLRAFTTFIESFRDTLRRFELLVPGHFYIPAHTDTIMRAIPSVTHFVTDQSIPLALLTEIGAGGLLPNIEELQFDAGSESVKDIVDQLIPKRPHRKSCLRRVRIYAYSWWCPPPQTGIDVQVLEPLHRLRARGLRVI